MNTQNSILFLDLYKKGSTWAFDDANKNIQAEPFVMGMSEIISHYTDKENCTAYFSLQPFPDAKKLSLLKEDSNGGWYQDESTNMTGWLCPVTRVYLNGIPNHIYFQIKDAQ